MNNGNFIIFKKLLIFLCFILKHVFIVSLYVCGRGTSVYKCGVFMFHGCTLAFSEDSFPESAFFHCVGFRDQTLVFKLVENPLTYWTTSRPCTFSFLLFCFWVQGQLRVHKVPGHPEYTKGTHIKQNKTLSYRSHCTGLSYCPRSQQKKTSLTLNDTYSH